MMEPQEVSRPNRMGPYSPGTVGPMLSALNVAVEIGRGLGLVRPTGFVEEMEGLFFRYASSLLAGLLKFVKYGFVGLALCMSSAAVYAVLYQLVMPNKLHERPLYFQYGSSECYSTNSCSAYPETTVDFLHKHNQWTPTPLVKTEALGERVLTADRVYVVDVEFHLPESGVNAHMGNWMVQVDLLTKDDKLLGRSVRPLILRYRSRIVRMVYTALMLPWILGGFVSESQHLKVTCFDRFQESGPHPLAKARVSLSSRELHVYEASLAITPQLNWLQHVMFHWFYTTALLAVLFLATVQATALGLAYLWAQLSIEESQVDEQGLDGHEPILTYTPDANAETGVHYTTSGGQVQGSDELLMGATGQAATRLETEGRSSSTSSLSSPSVSTTNGTHPSAPTTSAPSPPVSTIPAYVPPQSQQQQLGFRRRAAGQQSGGGRGGGTGAGTQSNHAQDDDELLLS